MSKKLLVILVAGVDLWAALFVTLIRERRANWEVSMAISDRSAPVTISAATPIQIWVREGQVGLWPAVDQPLTLDQVRRHLEATAARQPGRLEVRLLCDPRLTIDQWGQTALAVATVAEEIRIAPLPQP
jgi:hypothetical protein